MKNFSKFFGIIALVAVTGLSMAVCSNGSTDGGTPGGGTPTVTGVTITFTPPLSVEKDGSKQFGATVTGTNNPSQTVTWSIETAGKHEDTTIDTAGLLTVAAGETQTTLTIKATSTEDPSKSGTIVVNVYNAGATPTVSGVTVTNSGGNLQKGGNRTLTVVVAGTNTPPQTVTWSIDTAGKHPATTISSTGALTVAPGEPLNSLTVKATSTFDPSKSGTATVSLTASDGVTITITGIPSASATYLGLQTMSNVADTLTNGTFVSKGISSGGTSVTFTMKTYASGQPDNMGGAWVGSGSYWLNYHSTIGGSDTDYVFTNGQELAALGIVDLPTLLSNINNVPKYTFDGTNKTIAFDLFRPLP